MANGDEAAFRELVLQYSDILYNFIFSHLKEHAGTQEIMQDIFVQVWQTREALRDVRNFKPFLYVVSRNYALNELKKQMRAEKRRRQWVHAQSHDDELQPELDTDPRSTILEQAIRRLSAQQQTAWVLSRKEGLTYPQIAERMGLQRDTVKKYIHNATEAIVKYVREHSSELTVLLLLSLIGE